MIFRWLTLNLLFLLIACGYQGGGFGGLSGDGNSIVTISGHVMSGTTFQSTSAQMAGLESQSAFFSAFSSDDEFSPLIGGVENLAEDCAGASWSMTFVGSGGTSAGSGFAAADGSFNIPAIPQGKEAVLSFNCSGSVQKCLVKAGDKGISCNAIADGVVGALEAKLGKDLTNTDLNGKQIAKVASSIVESANSDSSDSQSLKTAIASCKNLPMNNLAELQAKKDCYKNSLEASSMSGTLDVVKSLTQQWNIRNLFNFLVATAGYEIYLDSMLYSTFGENLGIWLETDFVPETRSYIADLVNNPDYIGGNVSNGDQVVKIECIVGYSKSNSGGQMKYQPALATISGIPNTPTCNNSSALEDITGLSGSDSKLVALKNAIDNGENGSNQYQVGSISDPCPSTSPGSFCVYVPNLVMTSKVKEANRNDFSGEKVGSNEYVPRVDLIDVFEDADVVFNSMYFESSLSTGPYTGCMPVDAPIVDSDEAACMTWASTMSAPYDACFNWSVPLNTYEIASSTSTCNNFIKNIVETTSHPYNACVKMFDDAPVFAAGTTCQNWAKTRMQTARGSFAGMMGLYMYLKNPNSYANGGVSKLSLMDIHKVFTKPTLLNTKMIAYAPFYNWISFGNIHSPPVLDMTNPSTPIIPSIFHYNSSPVQADLEAAFADGSLVNSYNQTFAMFENIPTSQTIRAYVENASHHEAWNPYGSKYSYVPGVEAGSPGLEEIYPIFCRMLNRDKKDASNNLMPMEKELTASTKIECLSDPSAQVTVSATEGLFSAPSGFAYPYVLQNRGWNGDDKGKVFALADRKTGNVVRISGREVLILEAHAGNNAIVTSGAVACTSAPTDLDNSPAPLIKANISYGYGEYVSEEVVDAYCLGMSNLLENSTDTQVYYGGQVSVSYTDGNGQTQSYTMPQLGGRLTTSSSYITEGVCLFAPSDLFTFNQTTGMWQLNVSYSGYSTDTYTSNWDGNTSNLTRITTIRGVDFVDFCDATHGGTTKYYFSHFYDENTFDSTNSSIRNSRPVNIINSTNGQQVHGLVFAIGAIEAKLSNLRVASNNETISWSHNIKILNQKHNPKFDPYCDDLDNDGCDCFVGTTATIRSDNQACTLADNAAEPTISEPLIHHGDSSVGAKEEFLANYGGKYGPELVYTETADENGNSTPNEEIPLDMDYFMSNSLFFPEDALFSCKYLKTGETSYRTPTWVVWEDLTNMHMDGCPDASGVLADADDTNSDWIPDIGGGPIRIINPKPMKNAYDVARPKGMLTMMSYATKSVGQGVSIKATDKVFSFDEALALIAARFHLPPQGVQVYILDDSNNPELAKQSNPQFYPVRENDDKELNPVSATLRAITKPSVLD